MWDLPGPRIEPVFPALAGGLSAARLSGTTSPSGHFTFCPNENDEFYNTNLTSIIAWFYFLLKVVFLFQIVYCSLFSYMINSIVILFPFSVTISYEFLKYKGE